MAVDAAKLRILPILHPTTTMYAGEIARNDKIEALTNFEMERRVARKMTGVAVVIAPLESIAADPGAAANQQQNRHESE